jgi:hypothetical protein
LHHLLLAHLICFGLFAIFLRKSDFRTDFGHLRVNFHHSSRKYLLPKARTKLNQQFQVLSKFITLTVVKPTLKELLQITNKFWFPSVDPQLREEVENVLKILRMLLRSFLVFVTVVIVTFAIRPIFDDTLAISCYTPRSIPRVIFIIFNNLVFAVSAFAVGSFDMFVCAMVVLISVQFKILNRTILSLDLGKIGTRIDERKCLEKMRECVEQHNFLNT